MRKLQFCLVVFAVLALTFSAFAQVQNGQFTGTVLDPTGAAVAGAKVTVVNAAIGINVSTTTNSSGNYTVKELPVGSYKLTAEAAGFKTYTDNNVVLNAGVIAHVDFKLQIGKASEVVEVTGAAAQVNTEDSKLATTVSSTQINNLPLNGRDVFDLMKMSAGAVNVTGVDFENGHSTVVNGVREDFNGFLINGVSNKGLSGGAVNTPIEDSVEEFQQLQLNMSAQYGNSAGGTVNLVTKGGTNAWHGSGWEYIRNNALDSNWFFLNQQQIPRAPLHFNQFGVTVGGPIIKDKLFFFLSLQGDRYKTIGVPITVLQESQAWRDAVVSANTASGLNSTAAALYASYPPKNPGTASGLTADGYFTNPTTGVIDYSNALCLDQFFGGYTTLQHQKLISIFGVTAQDVTNMTNAGCSSIPAIQNGSLTAGRATTSIQENSVATFGTQTDSLGNLFNGNEGSLRVDYNWNTNNRMYIQFNYNRETDSFGACTSACDRGFTNPTRNLFPQGSFSFVHTFSPTVLNEFRAGYLQNNTAIAVNVGGIPLAGFADGTALIGSYNGYPQSFKENIYTYSDMVSIGHGNHNMKVGVDFRRNIENSEFNVARPSYYFNDQVAFAADDPYLQAAGVDPGICKAPCPTTSYNPAPQAQLTSNFRHWRNIEFGSYFQDDWKVNKRLTLNLGIRYDLYQRHHEEANLATTFIMGPSTPNSFILGPSNGLTNELYNANNPTTCVANGGNLALAQLVGGCGSGSGGFSPSSSLGQGDHNNFGPRLGFAWDVFGDGKTALRGGFGVAYEGTLYNPLSNSRWDLPYYSFNEVIGGPDVAGADIIYGPSVCNGAQYSGDSNCHQVSNVPVAFTGHANPNPNQGPPNQSQAQGNITGWDPTNPNQAVLTGIVLPKGIRDPYVYNFYLGIQHEIMPKTVLDVKYVGTAGHKLFRAEDINRQPGTYLPVDPTTGVGATVVDNFGRTLTGLGARTDPTQPYVSGRLNQNYSTLRTWENAVNSNYSSLQASVKHQMSHGLLFNVDYTYSHSIDNGSTWHSGATTSNGAAAGDGYTLDATQPGLDRGDSIFDIRQRLVVNYVYQLPGQNLKGALGAIAGGWSYNGIWAMQSGAHFEPYTSALNNLCEPSTCGLPNPTPCTVSDIPNNCSNIGGDFNLDGVHNDRPDSTLTRVSGVSHDSWANGWGRTKILNGDGTTSYQYASPGVTFSTPCLGCTGNLGRNSFVGPGQWFADMTLSKTFKFTERVNMKFDANGFNVFNHSNFLLATAGGGAHNKYTSANFGQAAGTLNPRQIQLGLKITF